MLSVGDHDFDTPSETVEACVTAVRGGHHHYTQLPGIPALARGDGEDLDACTGVPTTADQVIATPGGQAALYAAVQAVLDPGDHAVVVAPYYATYPGTFRAAGADFTVVETPAEDGFQPRADSDREGADAEHRARSCINTPNNPTGAVYSRARSKASPSSAASTISGCCPTRSTGRWAAASTSRRARCTAWPSARWSSTRCRRATA